MTYQLSWLVEKRVIYLKQSGIINYEELKESFYGHQAMRKEGIAPVHVINDSTNIKSISFGLSDIKKLLIISKSTPTQAWYVVVTPNRFIRIIANIAAQFSGGKQRGFVSLEEAILFLEDVDDSLGKIPLPSAMHEPLS